MVGWTDKLTLDGSVLVNLPPPLVHPPPHPSVSVLLIKAAVTWPGSEEFKSLSFACVRETLCGLQGAVCGMNAVLSTPPRGQPPLPRSDAARVRGGGVRSWQLLRQFYKYHPAQPSQPSPAQPSQLPGHRETGKLSPPAAAAPPCRRS